MTYLSERLKELIDKPAPCNPSSSQQSPPDAGLTRPHGPPTPPPHPLNPFYRDASSYGLPPAVDAYAARREREAQQRFSRVPVRSHFGEQVPDEPPPSYEASTAGPSASGRQPSASTVEARYGPSAYQPDVEGAKQQHDDLKGYRHKRYSSNGRDPRLTAAHRIPTSRKPFLTSAVLHAMGPSLPPATLATLSQLNKACYSVVTPYLYRQIALSRLALDALMWGVDLPQLDGTMYRPFDRTIPLPPPPPVQTPSEQKGILRKKKNKGKAPIRTAEPDDKQGFKGFDNGDFWSKPRAESPSLGGVEPTLETKRRKARLLGLVREVRLDGLVPDVRLCRAIASLPLAPPREAQSTSDPSAERKDVGLDEKESPVLSTDEKRRSGRFDDRKDLDMKGLSKEFEEAGDLLPDYRHPATEKKKSQGHVDLPVPLFPNVQKVIVEASYLDTLALWTVKASANPLSRTSATFRHHPFLSALLRLVPRSATFVFLSLNNDFRRATDLASSMHQITLMVAHSSSFKHDSATLLGEEAAQTGGVRKVILKDVDGKVFPAFCGVERVEIHTLAEDDRDRLEQFLQMLYHGDGPGTSQFFGKGLNPDPKTGKAEEVSGLARAERARLRLKYGPERLDTFAWV